MKAAQKTFCWNRITLGYHMKASRLYLLPGVFMAILFAASLKGYPQMPDFRGSVQINAGYAGPDTLPFWIRSNRFGDVPVQGTFTGLSGRLEKSVNPLLKVDWGLALQARADLGKSPAIKLVEANLRAKIWNFEIRAGRFREISGLCDTLLSSGSFTLSGNAPGVPQIQIAMPEYYTIPILGKILAVKGSMSHGWMGRQPVNIDWVYNDTLTPRVPTYLYQMSLYGRFGKENWRVKVYGGITHDALWGSEDSIFSKDYALSGLASYFYVATGKVYNNKSIQRTRIGNHQGSIDLGFEIDLRQVRLLAYRQNLYDAGALYYFANIRDGLNGLSIENKKNSNSKITWKRLLFEFLYTKNQAGEEWSPYTPSPYEDYYNHVIYQNGWSYLGSGLGTPFITPEKDVVKGLPAAPGNYFINNRVAVYHVGFAGTAFTWNVTGRLSFSRNFGTFQTAASGKEILGPFPTPYGVFPVTNQFSALLEASHVWENGIFFGISGAVDTGDLFPETWGFEIRVGKNFQGQ